MKNDKIEIWDVLEAFAHHSKLAGDYEADRREAEGSWDWSGRRADEVKDAAKAAGDAMNTYIDQRIAAYLSHLDNAGGEER